MKKLLGLLLLAQPTLADAWLCTEASSQRRGSSVYSCGVGIGKDENAARLNAFDNAKSEFKRICSASDDCKGHNITVSPERTSCDKNSDSYKCYRLIVFTIGEPSKNKDSAIAQEAPEKFEAFRAESIANLPKVKKGMTKKELFEAFGKPDSMGEYWTDSYNAHYHGDVCESKWTPCSVSITKGRVDSYSNINVIYTTDLE